MRLGDYFAQHRSSNLVLLLSDCLDSSVNRVARVGLIHDRSAEIYRLMQWGELKCGSRLLLLLLSLNRTRNLLRLIIQRSRIIVPNLLLLLKLMLLKLLRQVLDALLIR
jgi:hypothetical protein